VRVQQLVQLRMDGLNVAMLGAMDDEGHQPRRKCGDAMPAEAGQLRMVRAVDCRYLKSEDNMLSNPASASGWEPKGTPGVLKAHKPNERNPVPPSSVRRSRLSEGLPYPLGATWDGLGVNFALFSANATKVELCLFDEGAQREVERITRVHRRGLARLPARCPAGHGLRLPRARPLRACGRPSLQP
jgi:hypothetical protein